MISKSFIPNRIALITLAAACLVVLISLGIRQTFGLFFFDFETDLECTSSQFGLAIGIQMLFWGIFGPIFGYITDKFGGNKAIFIGFLFYLLGIVLLYSGPSKGFFFQLNLGVLVGIGLGATAITIPISIVAKHFPSSNRTIATGIVTAVGSFGYFISPLFTKYSLANFGWRETLFYFTIALCIGLVAAFFINTPLSSSTIDKQNNQTTSNVLLKAFKTKSYNYLTLGFFVCGFQITLVATHVPVYVRDRGMEDWTAATILAMIGLFNIVGTLTSGYLSTKYSKKIILSSIYFLRGISTIYFIFLPPSIINALIFGITFGLLWLATVPATNGIVASMFGTKNLGLLYGIVFLSHQIGSFLGAYLGGLFYELYSSYDYVWYMSIALSLFAAIIHLPINEDPVVKSEAPQAN